MNNDHLSPSLFVNGKIIAMDKGNMIAEAVAITNGKISMFGTNEEIDGFLKVAGYNAL
jgi:predicted amidohydrolase YtcJ